MTLGSSPSRSLQAVSAALAGIPNVPQPVISLMQACGTGITWQLLFLSSPKSLFCALAQIGVETIPAVFMFRDRQALAQKLGIDDSGAHCVSFFFCSAFEIVVGPPRSCIY